MDKELENEYIFPFAGQDEEGRFIAGIVNESQIISVLGELPNGENYNDLIAVAESKELDNWEKAIEYWRDNEVF